MAVQILQFRQRIPQACDWTQAELAEFYRVESALLQAGVSLEAERGLSDEGDPWFIFCRQDTGEVFIHFARIDGHYVIDGAPYAGVARHHDFKVLVRQLIASELFTLSSGARRQPKSGNVFMHPAALLIALVGAAFFHSGKADAAELGDHRPAPRRQGGIVLLTGAASEKAAVGLDAAQTATIISGILIGIDQQAQLPAAPGGALVAPASTPGFDPALLRAAVEFTSDLSQNVSRPIAPAAISERAATPAQVVMVVQDELHFAPARSAPAAPIETQLSSPPPAEAGGLAFAAAPPAAPAAAADRPFLAASTPAALPDDEAAAVVRAAANGDYKPLSLTGKLPTVLAELIQQGEHIVATPDRPPPASQGPTSGSTSLSQTLPSLPSGGDPGAGSQPPTSGEHSQPGPQASTPGPVTTPSTPAPPPAAPPPAGADAEAHAHDAQINAWVSSFMTEAATWQAVVHGRDFVIYDTHIFGPLPANTPLSSITLTFSDGSSVSLVGTAQEISHLYLHG